MAVDAEKWSKNAQQYRALNEKVPIVRHFNEVARDLLLQHYASAIRPGALLLDVCAGPGVFETALMDAIGDSATRALQIVISDFASGMVEEAQVLMEARLPGCDNIRYEVIDVQSIPLVDNHADVVIHMFGYFVPERIKAFREVHRVCKSGGVVVIGVWKYACLAPLLQDFIVHLGKASNPRALEVVHQCADGAALTNELLRYGYSKVDLYEMERIFELGFDDNDAIMGLFANPMISAALAEFSCEQLLSAWGAFVRCPDLKYPVDMDRQVLMLRYTANIVLCVK